MNNKFTQQELILEYVKEFGSIIPAKLVGKEYWLNEIKLGFFGADLPRRCRELRAKGKLISEASGRFEKFLLPV